MYFVCVPTCDAGLVEY